RAVDVVIPAACPDQEVARVANPSTNRDHAKHDIAEGENVVAAFRCRTDGQAHGFLLQAVARATASRVRVVMVSKSPSLIALRGTIQLPPMASTEGRAVYSARLAVLIPPVGTNFTPANGAERALMALAPPEASAGKNFRASRPAARAAWISVAVTAPGSGSTPRSWQRVTTSGEKPGETM